MQNDEEQARVIEPPERYSEWLDPSNKNSETLKGFISPYDAERMTAYAVSKTVSNARNEGAELVEALKALV